MIDRIYSKAERVIIWCPPCRTHLAQDLETAIDKLNSWKGHEAKILEALNNGSFGDAVSEHGRDWLPWKLPHTHEFHISKACIDALDCVMRLPWFERVWTLQELILAREAVIYFGPNTLKWQELISAFSKRIPAICYWNAEDLQNSTSCETFPWSLVRSVRQHVGGNSHIIKRCKSSSVPFM